MDRLGAAINVLIDSDWDYEVVMVEEKEGRAAALNKLHQWYDWITTTMTTMRFWPLRVNISLRV
jgi:hypothetical protein